MSAHWDKLMNLFFTSVSKHTLMVTIQDARHPMQKADLKFLNYLRKFSFAQLCVLNKTDKLKKQKDRAILDKQIKKILNEHTYIKKITKVSAETKQGTDLMEQRIVEFLTK
jgi:GTP-binding protein